MLFTLLKNDNHYGNNNRSIAHCKDLSVVLLLYLLVSRHHKSYNNMHQPIEEGKEWDIRMQGQQEAAISPVTIFYSYTHSASLRLPFMGNSLTIAINRF